MDQNLKKKITLVKGLIQKKQYKQALDQLQVLMYKYAKVYQVHLMSGLCYEKVGKQQQAENCYKEVIDLKEDQPNAIKALCEIYTKRGDVKKATLYLEKNVEVLKKADEGKYRQAVVKLVEIYRKDENLQKIHNIFMEYVEKQQKIGEDFVSIASAYFHTSTNCKSFNLQKFQLMGMLHNTTNPRPLVVNARQKLNILLIDIVNYLSAVSRQYHLTQKDIANSLYQMKYHFPSSTCMKMLRVLDAYCVGQVGFSGVILEEIYKLLVAYFRKEDNSYAKMEFIQPEIWTVEMVLAYEYLAFFKEFFQLDERFGEVFELLAQKQQAILNSYKPRQQYSKKISNFILKKCRHLHQISEHKNVQQQIQDMKKRILLLQDSYLQQVIAKIGMNCFVNYQKLDDMKNMLKVRIKNLGQQDMVPHLYKYYVEYLMKIAKVYKVLDEEIDIYEAVEYVNRWDGKDVKWLVEGWWLRFCKAMLLESSEEKNKVALESISQIQALVGQTFNQLKSTTLRKIAVMKVFINNYQIQEQLKLALSLDRSFPNLQSLGFYCFHNKKYQQSLNYLKQAFVLNQTHYHTNRLIFILLYKLGYKNQAIDFVERIKEGFRAVFWVNYVLAVKYINFNKFIQAESYLNAAIECFSAGCHKKYKFSYEKTVPHQEFAFLFMINQNQFSILYDELIFPQTVIYEQLQMVSSLHFEISTKRTQIKLFVQMGQVLKVLGRTKSALNYLAEGFTLSEQLSEQQKNQAGQRFQICVLHKQYATLLFYMQMFRESQILIISAYTLCQEQLKEQTNQQRKKVLQTLQSQIDSLSFEVGVQRLSIMSRFQSYQTIQQYLQKATIRQPKHPSVNFLKAKYQFYILEYLHTRMDTKKIIQGIEQYLLHFKLPLNSINSAQFQNRYIQLNYQQKQMVKQSLEDYFVIRYISQPQQLTPQTLMPLIQLFPRSTVFYIIYGMSTQDVRMKTAAFLKCIQLDKESPISIDLLASLYLKQKNYLAATKLFLKSLEMDILNSKCYLGLSICLFGIIGKVVLVKGEEVMGVVHKALVRISSYMEYLRTVDPSENYHLLKFMKLLVNDQPMSNFELKTTLQASKRNTKNKYKDTLIYELLEQATQDWKNHNLWQEQGQVKILQEFMGKFSEKGKQKISEMSGQIAVKIVENAKKQFVELLERKGQIRYEYEVKQIQKVLSKMCIGVNMGITKKFDQKLFSSTISILQQLQHKYQRLILCSQQSTSLIQSIKSYLYQYILLFNEYPTHKNQIHSLFLEIPSYNHLSKYPHLITNYQAQLYRQVLLNPNNDQLKKFISAHMVINAGKPVMKGKYDYKVELVNNTHDNLTVKKETLKKLLLLYRDPESWVGYLQMCWEEPNARTKGKLEKWLSILAKLEQSQKQKEGKYLEKKTGEKVNALKVEIYGYYVVKFGQNEQLKKIHLNFTKEEQSSLKALTILGNFYNQSTSQNLKALKPLIIIPENHFILLQILSFITNKYSYSVKIEEVLVKLVQMCEQQKLENSVKAHLLLLRYLYVLHRTVKTEEDLIGQITDLQKLVYACAEAGVSENTLSILTCAKCLISADYPNLQVQLVNASKKKIVTYSDQLLINFFEIIRLYKQVETNPNKQGVIEEFALYVEQMILLVKDPFYQGFFNSLKALVNAIIVPDQAFVHDRNLRMAMLLAPHGAKVFVKSNQQ